MGTKRTPKTGPEQPGPSRQLDAARTHVANGVLDPYPEPVRKACARLLDDLRMKEHWESGFNAGDFMQAVYAFDLATGRDAWGRKAQGAREEWLKRFNSTVAKLKELMTEAPVPPEEWGFPVRNGLLMHSAKFIMEVPPPEDVAPHFQTMWSLERKLDESGVTLVHLIDHYAQQQNVDAAPLQILPKPADADSDRAHFVKSMGLYTDCTDAVIATVTAVVFDLDSYDDRTVRKRIRGR